jgi:DNA-binding transcriptional LysR family regulator
MLQLHQLQSFVAVVEAGSFTAGAATLGLSKAVVSLHVKQLEAELGCALLVRTTRRVEATDAGERFHRAARRLLHEAESAVAEVRGVHEGLSGTLRLTSLPEYVTAVLVPAITVFAARNPRLRVLISASSGASDLVRERFDLAIRLGRLPDSTLHATRLGSFRVHAVATPELLAARGVPRVPAELTRLPWVLFGLAAGRGEPGRPFTWSGRDGVTHEVALSAMIRTDSASAVHAFARSHVGAAVLPDWMVREDLASGRLVRLVPDHEIPPQGIFAVRPGSGHVPPAVRRFVDFFRTFVNEGATIISSAAGPAG